jgi:hypothetical protein
VEELKKGEQVFDIPTLFPKKQQFFKIYYGKITPLNNQFMLVFLYFCGFVFLLTPGLLPLLKTKTMKKIKMHPGAILRFHLPAQVLTSLVCIFTFFYLLAYSKYSQGFIMGLPESLSGLSPLQVFLIHIPIINIVVIFAMLVLLIVVFKNCLWSKFMRFFYAVIIILLSVNIGLFKYWGLLKLYHT